MSVGGNTAFSSIRNTSFLLFEGILACGNTASSNYKIGFNYFMPPTFQGIYISESGYDLEGIFLSGCGNTALSVANVVFFLIFQLSSFLKEFYFRTWQRCFKLLRNFCQKILYYRKWQHLFQQLRCGINILEGGNTALSNYKLVFNISYR